MASAALMLAGALHTASPAGTTAIAAANIIATGTFVSKESGLVAAGTFEVQELDGKFTLMIKSDFKVSEGPDLFFAFNPLAADKTTGTNAKTGALKIDPQLTTLKGAQTFNLPSTFDITKYQSLLIHCWQYDHLYASAVLKKVAATAVHAPVGQAGAAKKTAYNRGEKNARKVLWTDGAGQRSTDANGRLSLPLGSDPFRK